MRRIAAAGAVAWAVPTVQTINMSRAFAQTQASDPKACSWFRITKSDLTNDGTTGTCGGSVSSADSCLSAFGPTDCSPIIGVPSTRDADAWTVCLGPGYLVQEVALSDVNGRCWRSAQKPGDPTLGEPTTSDGSGGWQGWASSGGCVTTLRPLDGSNAPVNIDRVDMMVCAVPGTFASPSASSSPSPTDSPTPSDSPSPSGATGPTTGSGVTPSGTPTP